MQGFKYKDFACFGSVTTNRFNKENDIDFLLSFPENISIEEYTDNYFELHYKLRELLNREIDIVTKGVCQILILSKA